jgi:hypothetical protein
MLVYSEVAEKGGNFSLPHAAGMFLMMERM